MQTRPLVYVSRITNLSDARYCAGMGADLLGFVIDPADPDYVSPESYQQLIGWISGPARVVELGSAVFDADALRAHYAPDFLHVSLLRLSEVPTAAWKLIVDIHFNELSKVPARADIAHILVNEIPDSLPATLVADRSVLVGRRPGTFPVGPYLSRHGASGIALQGSRESAPGLKDYDHLSQVLEELNG